MISLLVCACLESTGNRLFKKKVRKDFTYMSKALAFTFLIFL